MGDRVKIGIAKFIHDGNFARAEFDAGPDIWRTTASMVYWMRWA